MSTAAKAIEKWCPQEYDQYWKVNWTETPGGQNATNPCPKIKGTLEYASAYRYCELNGTWEIKYTSDGPVNYTHFDVCFIPQLQELWKMCDEIGDNTCQQVGKVTRIIEMVGLSFSLVSLIISLFIFFSYRVLKNNRTTIHKHLFIATLLQVIFRLIRYIDMEQEPSFNFLEYWYLFEVNASLLEYAKTAMFMWMFIEGLYLHNMITARVFQEYTYIKIYCYVGWIVPGVMTAVWLGIMFTKETKLTWEYYYLLDSFWILEGPRSIILIVNLLFLLNIVRVLIVKLRESHTSEIEQVRKAVRAAIFLLPLMGIAHILFFYHKFNTAWKFALWSYSAYFLITFQGFFVAVLYCFLNGEVQAAIKNSFYLYMSLRNYDYTPGRHFTLVSVLGEDGSIQNGDQPSWNQCCKPNPTSPDGKEIRFQHMNRKDTSTVITELTMVESNIRRSSSREKLSTGNGNEVSDTSLIQLRNTP